MEIVKLDVVVVWCCGSMHAGGLPHADWRGLGAGATSAGSTLAEVILTANGVPPSTRGRVVRCRILGLAVKYRRNPCMACYS